MPILTGRPVLTGKLVLTGKPVLIGNPGLTGRPVLTGKAVPLTDSLTQVVQAVAGLVEGSSIELQADDGEDEDREEEEEGNVDQGPDSLGYRAHHNL